MKELDVLTVGEILIDLTQTGVDERGVRLMAANPGGAPANVAVAAARLGAKSGFVGCVGADAFGESLTEVLRKNGVDASGVHTEKKVPTTLAVVTVNPDGERSFTFYRSPGADLCLRREYVPEELLGAKVLHFGSVSLTDDPSRSATLALARDAKAKGALITYDPNYRAALWPDRQEAIHWMREPLELADVLKISDEEAELLSGVADIADAADVLHGKGIPLVVVTLGAKGVYYRFGDLEGTVGGYPVEVADTNGAGDTFFGAVLSRLSRRPGLLKGLEQAELEAILDFGNRAAALTTSRHGAIPAMPYLEEVENAFKN